MKQLPIAILGAGAWGTALAIHLARLGQEVRLWSIDQSEIDALLQDKENKRFLPGFVLPDHLKPMSNLQQALDGVDDILMVIPSIGYRHVLNMVKPLLHSQSKIISATKGIDAKTGRFLNDLIVEVLGDTFPFAVLSGPSFAKEVAEGLPTAVVLASHFDDILPVLFKRFDSPIFRVYTSHDVIGVEVGSVLKNVIAIATGICEGMGFATNTQSAMITLGLQEITRLGETLGGKQETFMGLSGMGDLILTASDNKSRNRRFGFALGQGKDIKTAEAEIGQAIEGKYNTELVMNLAEKHQVFMPICQTVSAILNGKLSVSDKNKVIEQFFSSR